MVQANGRNRTYYSKPCNFCGSLGWTRKQRLDKITFCSKECRDSSKLIPNTKCTTCGTPLYRQISKMIEGRKFFCNRECKNKHGFYTLTNPEPVKKENKECLSCFKLCTKIYCSIKCQQNYNIKKYVSRWVEGLETGYVKGSSVSNFVRRYLFEKYNSKCRICGWSEINPYSGKVPLVVNHIDGNSENCAESNLELICNNCDSLTATYKGLNRGNGRHTRMERYHAGKSF